MEVLKKYLFVTLIAGLCACNPLGEDDEIQPTFSPEGDSISPTAPTSPNLSGNATLTASPTLTWTASTDNIAVTSYEIAIGTAPGLSDIENYTDIGNVISYQFSGLSPALTAGTNYYISVRARDAASNTGTEISSTSFTPALVISSGAYIYPDGTYADDCNEYLNSSYYQTEGDGLYNIDPDGAGPIANFIAYCDMTTDGGGWTLIGRGREEWMWSEAGLNTTNVHLNIGTTNAFIPAYYPAATVDEIIDQNTSALTDGLRIKRSLDTTGSTYQEGRWFFTSLTNYSWLFDTTYALSDVVLDTISFGANDTRDTTEDGNNQNRFFTWAWSGHSSKRGFSFGGAVNAGTNSPTNFLWENGSENHSIPYTEVYVRD